MGQSQLLSLDSTEIVSRVREMLPAYGVVFARYELDQDLKIVMPLSPRKD
jgi:hypothetical protein